MLDAPLRRISAPPLNALAASLAQMGLGANIVTFVAFGVGILAVIFYAFAFYGAGLTFLALNRLLDGVDGALARRRGVTERGEFLDAALSYLVLAAVPFAFALADPQGGLAAAFMILGLLVIATTDLATRNYLSDTQKARSVPHWFLLCERTEIFLIIVLMTLLPWAFSIFAYLFGALCFVTGGLRIASALAVDHIKTPS
jgi:phosphatidylglycerophosphate synthase